MSLKASIEIAAPPEVVRAKFLDFAAIPSYTKAFESITAPKPGAELSKGEKVVVKLANSPAFTGVIETNTPAHFSWTGSIPLIFTGTHSFHFVPSTTTPGGTSFTQEEVFSGVLGWLLMGDGAVGRSAGMREKTKGTWDKFNADLKAWCEEQKQ
ncbi:activator of hsp90 ATPase 1 family protein [Stagonosporopsis vannaccii]|nr:activator of hsp90 ATPase 1 family protein [Stagonosporopsis vannaccii]